jgi:hypothetical protein
LLLLGGKDGSKGTFPMANALTQNYEVSPGDLWEGLASINMDGFGTTIYIGYNVAYRRPETLQLLTWPEATYGVADYNYETTDNFAANHAFSAIDKAGNTNTSAQNASARMIPSERIELSSAATPRQIIHTINGSIHHELGPDARFCIGIGGFFDIATNENTALKESALWARLGLSF